MPVRTAPGSTTSLRVANQRRVVDVLLQYGALTQAQIARHTGLASGTVSNIVRELAAAELVSTRAGAGRRGTRVRLGRGAGLVAAVDFGHNHVAVAIGDMTGEVLGEVRETLAPEYDTELGLSRAVTLLDRLLGTVGSSRGRVRTIAMGLPTPIVNGVVMGSEILPGWAGVRPGPIAESALERPVLIDNDANLGALGEHRRGVGRGHANVVFVKVSSGVGAGLIIDGRIFRGSDGTAGEIGHLTLDEQGPLCRCGSRGCLEAYAATGPALALMGTQMPDPRIEDVISAAESGNLAARRVFEDAGVHLGWGLAMVTNLVNPGIIAVGGDMSKAGELLLDSTRRSLRRHVLAGATSTPIEVAALGDRASMIGGLMAAIDATDLLPEA